MEAQKQPPRKAHSMLSSSGPLNIGVGEPPPLARHSRPAGASTPCQNAPLDLTKPLDLSVKRPRSPSAERSHVSKCYREINLEGISNRKSNSPALIPPFNFKTAHESDRFTHQIEHSKNCSRRTGLIGSSPRNYNYKGRAVVAPRREQPSEVAQHRPHKPQHHVDRRRDVSSVSKHGHHSHVPVQQSLSVPYSSVNHSSSQTNTFAVSSSPSSSSINSHMLLPPPPYPTTISGSHRSRPRQHESQQRHKPILPKSTLPIIVSTCSLAGKDSETNTAPPPPPASRVAHVTAFTHNPSPFTQSVSPESHSSSYLHGTTSLTQGQSDEFSSTHRKY